MTRHELTEQIRAKGSFLCVGLDTDVRRLPTCLAKETDPIFAFNKAIIDATSQYCVAYKPNLAFYEAEGSEGMRAFEKTVSYLKETCPHHLLIADAKRGDIGNTSRMYARTFFERYDVDALTVAPYMGEDSIAPFLGYEGKWVVVLALTSNKGSADFQLTTNAEGERLFETVIRKSEDWASADQIMFVVGATQGSMFADIRRIAPSHFLLVPGVGAQGGSLEQVCHYGMTEQCGLIVNSSRGIIYADNGDNFAEAAGKAAKGLKKEMEKELRKKGITL